MSAKVYASYQIAMCDDEAELTAAITVQPEPNAIPVMVTINELRAMTDVTPREKIVADLAFELLSSLLAGRIFNAPTLDEVILSILRRQKGRTATPDSH